MYTVTDARFDLACGARFCKEEHPKNKRLDGYFIKRPSLNGFRIPMRTGRYLEKAGIKPELWPYGCND